MKLIDVFLTLLRPVPAVCLGVVLSPSPAMAGSLRPLSTDRPDTTESPYTVDAGHFQFEWEIAAAERDGGNTSYHFAELNAKFGLDPATDVQFVVPFFSHEEGGAEGMGDAQIRLKRNLWGNDGGTTALAVMPFVKLPTANGDLGNGKLEFGCIVPLAIEGPAGWSFGLQTEIDLSLDADGSGYHPVFLHSATAGHDLTTKSAGFVELVSILSTDSGARSEAYLNLGCTWSPSGNLQFDGGFRIGLTDASTDLTPFLGVSVKY